MTTKRGRKPKYLHTIILDNVNAREIYKRYRQNRKEEHSGVSPILEYSKGSDGVTTQITELSSKRRPENIFLDAHDSQCVTMIDYINYGCLPDRTDLCCWHDHHPFNTSPIGLPIKYVNKRPDKVQLDDTRVAGTNDYYLTVGVFCSFACCLAFLKEHRHNALFRNSKSLLYSLYFKLYNTKLKVKPASSWECLKDYGGKLAIEEFRKSFCTCNYIITPNIKRPYMVSVGKYIEERRCGYI